MRVRSALAVMDSLVRTLAISSLDRNDHRVSMFSARSVPTVSSPSSSSSPMNPWQGGHQAMSGAHVSAPQDECACSAYTLGNNWAQAREYTPLWLMTPAWNKDSSDAETRKEESRRLVWSCVTLIAGYTSYTSASNPLPTMDLFLMEPANVCLPFGVCAVDPVCTNILMTSAIVRVTLPWRVSGASVTEAGKQGYSLGAVHAHDASVAQLYTYAQQSIL